MSFGSRLTYRFRKLRRTKIHHIDGLTVRTFDAPIDESTRKSLWRGSYEGAERDFVRALVRAGDRVLEGGGGIGVVSMVACRAVASGGWVLVYEPNARAADAIIRNAGANGLNIEVVKGALSDEQGSAVLRYDTSFIGGVIGGGSQDHPRSETVSTHDIHAVVADRAPNVLILDVEGFEGRLIARCPIDGLDVIILETHPALMSAAELSRMYRRLLNSGFVMQQARRSPLVVAFARESRLA